MLNGSRHLTREHVRLEGGHATCPQLRKHMAMASRYRRLAKSSGLILCAFLFVIWALTLFIGLGYAPNDPQGLHFSLDTGRFWLYAFQGDPNDITHTNWGSNWTGWAISTGGTPVDPWGRFRETLQPHLPDVEVDIARQSGSLSDDSSRRLIQDIHYWRVRVPIWLMLTLALIPTMVLFYRDRRRPGPGCCQRCGYNLTGNTKGVCSECGTTITPTPPASDRSIEPHH